MRTRALCGYFHVGAVVGAEVGAEVVIEVGTALWLPIREVFVCLVVASTRTHSFVILLVAFQFHALERFCWSVELAPRLVRNLRA